MRMRESFVLIYRDSISRDATSNIQKRRGSLHLAGACVRGEDCAFWTVFLHLLFSRGSCVVGGDQSVWRSESFEAAREGVRAAV